MDTPGPTLDALRRQLGDLGAAPLHVQHLWRRWLQAQPLDAGRRRPEDFLPARVREALPRLAEGWAALARLRSQHPAADGSVRLLVELADGQTVESVLLPRGGLCVSTQVGCAVGCVFCMTGRGGLRRQLGGAEIVAQVALARRLRAVGKVVFMGMGEPAHNLDQVLEAIGLLGQEGGIGHKNLVFSTVGDRRVFERLPQGRVKPALALSLHSTRAALRAELLPHAPRIDPAELVALGDAYARATGYPLQIQWTLIDGVNDGDDEVDALAQLLAGRRAMLNLIPCNPVEGQRWARPPWERTLAITRALNRRGVLTRVRQSAGQDVDAGCGQLRSRELAAAAAVTDRRVWLVTTVAAALGARGAQAQPARTLRIVVPFTPGGSTDILARALAPRLAQALGQTVVVDNKPGAGGSIGAAEAARAAPDGQTLLMGHIGTLAVNPAIYPKLAYDPVKSFTPVAWVARVPNVLVVNAQSPARTFKEFLDRVRAAPGRTTYSSGGNGSAAHIAVEYLKLRAGLFMLHIPYRGTAPSVADLLAGQVDCTFTGSPAVLPHVRSGRLRALAVSSLQRLPSLPEVPTVAESGFPDFEADQWYGLVAPAGTPAGVVARLNAEVNAALALADVARQLAAEGATPAPGTPQAFGELIAREIPRWAEVVKAGNITAD